MSPWPWTTLPSSLFSRKAQSADHEPTSLQAVASGTQRKLADLLGDGVVERDGRRLRVGVAQDLEVHVLDHAGKRGAARAEDLGRMRLEHLDQGRGLAHKDADVPEEIVAVEIALSDLLRWLLHEAPHAQRGEIAPLDLDIAVTGVGAVGLHPEHHEHPVLCGLDGSLHSRREGLNIGEDVIRRSQHHHGFRITLRGDQRGDAGGRRGAARDGFKHDGRVAEADLLELLGGEEAMLVARQDDQLSGQALSHATAGLLKQCLVAGDLVELLGKGFTRKRPKARARSSTEDERQDLTHAAKLALECPSACLA